MRLQFFPSRQIGWYMARLFLVRTLAVLLMLVLVLQTLDLLGESGKILSVAGNGEGDLWRYIGWRAPQLIARFLPFSVLLATLITFATLSQNSEVVAMKAAGCNGASVGRSKSAGLTRAEPTATSLAAPWPSCRW